MGCLYKLTSPSGKSYVGISKYGLDKRWAKHVEHALGKRSNGYLYAALRKYGVDGFSKEVLAQNDDWASLCAMEIHAIREHGTRWPGGYNLTDGGEGTPGLRSAEVKAKISAAQKKRFQNPEQRAALHEFGERARQVKSAKAALRRDQQKLTQAAYIASAEFKAARSAAIKSGMEAPEVRAKVEAAAKRRQADPAWRKKISETKRGVSTGPCTEQRRRLVSEASKREWADPVIREKRLAALAKARETKAQRA